MAQKRIIPCLDVKDGRVVKGTNFVGLKDAGDPVELAAYYDQQGADELVFLDITASQEKRKTLVELVRRTVQQITVPLIVGGGIATLEDIQVLLAAGAAKVSISTAAVSDPGLIQAAAEEFGSQRVIVAIDAKAGLDGGWEVYTHGGRTPTGLDVVAWAQQVAELGAGEILLTSMDRDGTKAGYDNVLNQAVVKAVNIPVIASGGAGTLEDLREAFELGQVDAVLAASIFHYKELTIPETKEYLAKAGIPVRRVEAGELKYTDGLIPAVVQDVNSGQVLMVAYMNQESLEKTLATGRTWFYSRSRQELWPKGETSGNIQEVVAITTDCDRDTLLIKVIQQGSGACHEGTWSCFHYPLIEERSIPGRAAVLDELRQVIRERREHPVEGSYTNYLFDKGVDKICKKIGEEAAEVIVAAKNRSPEELSNEAADLLYHLLVLLEDGQTPNELVWEVLAKRRNKG